VKFTKRDVVLLVVLALLMLAFGAIHEVRQNDCAGSAAFYLKGTWLDCGR